MKKMLSLALVLVLMMSLTADGTIDTIIGKYISAE